MLHEFNANLGSLLDKNIHYAIFFFTSVLVSLVGLKIFFFYKKIKFKNIFILLASNILLTFLLKDHLKLKYILFMLILITSFKSIFHIKILLDEWQEAIKNNLIIESKISIPYAVMTMFMIFVFALSDVNRSIVKLNIKPYEYSFLVFHLIENHAVSFIMILSNFIQIPMYLLQLLIKTYYKNRYYKNEYRNFYIAGIISILIGIDVILFVLLTSKYHLIQILFQNFIFIVLKTAILIFYSYKPLLLIEKTIKSSRGSYDMIRYYYTEMFHIIPLCLEQIRGGYKQNTTAIEILFAKVKKFPIFILGIIVEFYYINKNKLGIVSKNKQSLKVFRVISVLAIFMLEKQNIINVLLNKVN